ncbi:hypothetical protein BDV95DRAFT_172211 [Massariosphaeria phaeospora]|uniref:Uncharacterized protein n=1 Tax=Massariosphaeria phaeospora TaxID=100035 RepID=A0A7C8I9E3_9PLEO|nr:hypothetical protein BDV95DRAFT_172211 [Massariosphaeria phaeospora]
MHRTLVRRLCRPLYARPAQLLLALAHSLRVWCGLGTYREPSCLTECLPPHPLFVGSNPPAVRSNHARRNSSAASARKVLISGGPAAGQVQSGRVP